MTQPEHPVWDDLLAAAQANGDLLEASGASPTGSSQGPGIRSAGESARLATVREHALACSSCRIVWEQIGVFLSLARERSSLPNLDPGFRARTMRAIRERLAPRPLAGLRRILATPVEVALRPSLRGPQSGARRLFTTPDLRITLTTFERDGRRILRGQVVPTDGGLPLSRSVQADALAAVVPVDRFGEFVVDPLPADLRALSIQLDGVVVEVPVTVP